MPVSKSVKSTKTLSVPSEGEVLAKPLPSVAQKVLSTLYQELDILVEEFLKPFGVTKEKK